MDGVSRGLSVILDNFRLFLCVLEQLYCSYSAVLHDYGARLVIMEKDFGQLGFCASRSHFRCRIHDMCLGARTVLFVFAWFIRFHVVLESLVIASACQGPRSHRVRGGWMAHWLSCLQG